MVKAHLTHPLKGYFEANRTIMAEREEIPSTIINTFLGVVIWGEHQGSKGEPLTLKELSERVGLPYTTVSRHLRYLGDYERTGVPGLGLVRTDIYPLNRRQKVATLTAKGKALASRLEHALGG
jgi:DNA-binding transcriptional ArsR family regulator